jgi:hypothetical protein
VWFRETVSEQRMKHEVFGSTGGIQLNSIVQLPLKLRRIDGGLVADIEKESTDPENVMKGSPL